MSRYYEMSVEIGEYDHAKTAEIRAAAEQQWPFDDWTFSGDENQPDVEMRASAQHWLCGGEDEEQFTERLVVAIWRANGGYCCVVVDATYMENLPYETHTLDESDYARLIQGEHAAMQENPENETQIDL